MQIALERLTESSAVAAGMTKHTAKSSLVAPRPPDEALRLRVLGLCHVLDRCPTQQLEDLARLAASTCATPIATIGVRGTEFWGGPIDDQALGVLLLQGVVRVSNAAGARILNRRGQGTNIVTPGAAPGAITFWPQDKVNRALATVTFQ